MLTADEAMDRANEVGVDAQLASLNAFRVLLLRPLAAKGFADLLLELLSGRALDHRLRELVIMRVGWVTGSGYEWTQHWTLAREIFGCRPEDLLAVRDWERSHRLGEAERSVLAATDETLSAGVVSAATLTRCREAFGDAAVVELLLCIGLWRTVSEVTRSFEIPVEEGVALWPPDGVSPG
jgi:alkylhydroperoxidase family enzyme